MNGRILADRIERDRILSFFSWDHLRGEYQGVSQPFGELAMWVQDNLKPGPEKAVALRKLLEAKDAAVRTIVAELDP